jgi:hypothetical protein
MTPILRVQDSDGRGPFRPGFTKEWCEHNHNLPSFMQEFPELPSIVHKYHKRGLHLGTGVRGYDGLKKWFSDSELEKLFSLGFSVVHVTGCAIVCESENQLVFALSKPLSQLSALEKTA